MGKVVSNSDEIFAIGEARGTLTGCIGEGDTPHPSRGCMSRWRMRKWESGIQK